MSLIDRVIVGKKKEEPRISFARASTSSNINPQLKEILDEALTRIGNIEKQLETVERNIEEIKQTRRR